MANERFKVKFGLAVGDTSATIDATSGDIVTSGIAAINGGQITTTATNALVFNANATTVNAFGAATTLNIGNVGGTTTVNGNLTVGVDVDVRGGDITNSTGALQITTASNGNLTLDPNGTGQVIINADLDVNGSATVDSLQVDNININNNDIISTNTDGNINIIPNGTGDVYLTTDVVYVGDLNATATISTNGTGNLVLNTNANVNSGSFTIANGINGNLTLAPNGTGNVVFTFNNGGNITNNRNYLYGAIRNANTQGRGNMWELLATTPPTAPTTPVVGLSVDNSLDTTKTSGMLIRQYGAAGGSRARIIFERSRGTAASPSAVVLGDFLGEVDATGYSTAGWLNDLAAAVPAFYGFNATENWTGINNCGTQLSIGLQPTATTLTTGSQTFVIAISPQNGAIRADQVATMAGKTTGFIATGCSITGTTLTIGTVTSGTVAVGQMLQNASQTIPFTCHIISGSGSTWTLSEAPGNQTGQTITGRQGFVSSVASATTIVNNLRLLTNNLQSSGGTTQVVTSNAGATLELRGDNIQLENAAGASIVGSSITYNRVYAQWEQDGPVTPVAANTSYVFPIGTAVDNNIATVVSTSRITPGAAGKYNLQFSLQWANADNQEHTFYVWLRKNGVNVANSTGDITCLKSAKGITGWNYIISSANATDYWELAYQVTDTNVTFPYVAAQGTAPNDIPACPALITTLTPVGA